MAKKPDRPPKKPKPDGDAPKRTSGGGGGFGRSLAWILALLCLYAVSAVPAVWIVDRIPHGAARSAMQTVMGAVFWPLERLSRAVPPMGDAYRWAFRQVGAG